MSAINCKAKVLGQETVAADIRRLTVEWPDARPEFLLTPNVSFHSVEADKQVRDDAEIYIRRFFEGRRDELPIVVKDTY